jgi:hypothetical protein
MMMSTGVGRGMATILTSKLSPIQIGRIFARDLRLVFFDVGQSHLGPLGSSATDVAFTLIAVAVCAYACVALIRTSAFSVWGFVIIGLCFAMVPLLLRDLLVRGNFVYQGRYFLPLLLGVQLAVAALFGRVIFSRHSSSVGRTSWAVLLVVILAGGVLSCAVASQATTWWNKDYERAPAVAALINATQRPLVISDYFTPSILALSLHLDPAIPMRLNLRCAQCAFSRGSLSFATAGYRSIFAVQAPNAASRARYYLVDPVPFPRQASPLNMFAFVSPAD